MISLQDIKKSQGIEPGRKYPAVVVENDDTKAKQGPKHCRRIRARIPVLMDEIPDDKLPWAIPCDGQGDGATAKSGSAVIPRIGSKILLSFQDGNALFPIWHEEYPTEEPNVIQESVRNYPDRRVQRLSHNMLLVTDESTNEIFLRLVGDSHFYIEGNTHLEIKGNVVEKIHGNKDSIIKGNLQETIEGNVVRYVKGKDVEMVEGPRHVRYEGDYTTHYEKDVARYYESDVTTTIDGKRSLHLIGNDSQLIDGDQENVVGGKRLTVIQGHDTQRYQDVLDVVVSKDRNTIIGGSDTTSIRKRWELYIEESGLIKSLSDFVWLVEGKLKAGAKEGFEFKTPESFLVESAGDIDMKMRNWNQLLSGSRNIEIDGNDGLSVQGNKTVSVLGTYTSTPFIDF